MKNSIKEYVKAQKTEMLEMLRELCLIPAPSHFEHGRAEYCKQWLEKAGASGVYIDDALNVIFPFECEGRNDLTVFAAHTDTVFPDKEPMPYVDDGKRIHSPGVADDTASVVALLMMARYFVERREESGGGILFVCNSCEEGLGNLKGTRKLFEEYGSRIKQFITFDSKLNVIIDRCVGSHRYEVTVTTEGGHSYNSFGSENAICEIARIIGEIYKTEVPKKENTRTTYNVGVISGGTSVNTVAQNAKMLCEYRSDDRECLEYMRQRFYRIFEGAKARGVRLKATVVGERPCGNTEEAKLAELRRTARSVVERVIHDKAFFVSGSTDCNIPLSLGVPAICVGVNKHCGIHTREEWVDKESMLSGLEIAILLGKELSEP